MDRLRDRVILITGSTGIAAATAVRCAAEGAAVFVVSRTAGPRPGARRARGRDRGQAAWAAADLTRRGRDRRRRQRPPSSASGGSTACSRSRAAAAGGSATARSTTVTAEALGRDRWT